MANEQGLRKNALLDWTHEMNYQMEILYDPNLQNTINTQATKGYRLHTISTTSSGSKGLLGGDKIQATMVFERID